MTRTPHPIEVESYRILRARVDTAALPTLTRDVTERVVHTTADPSWADDLVLDEATLRAGRDALLAGAPLVVDVRMLAAGITSRDADVAVEHAVPGQAGTRTASGIAALARRHPRGAVWAIGNAPTALREVLRLAQAGELEPVLVVGLPVGFVDAAESKAALRASGLPSVSNHSARGGAAVAAAAVNALLYGTPVDR